MKTKYFRFLFYGNKSCLVHFGELTDTCTEERFTFLYLYGSKKREAGRDSGEVLFLYPKYVDLVVVGNANEQVDDVLTEIFSKTQVDMAILPESSYSWKAKLNQAARVKYLQWKTENSVQKDKCAEDVCNVEEIRAAGWRFFVKSYMPGSLVMAHGLERGRLDPDKMKCELNEESLFGGLREEGKIGKLEEKRGEEGKLEARKTKEEKIEAEKTEARKTKEEKVETGKTEARKTKEEKIEAGKTEARKTKEEKAEAEKTEAVKIEEEKIDEGKAEEGNTEEEETRNGKYFSDLFEDCLMSVKILDKGKRCGREENPDGFGCAMGCTLKQDCDVCKYQREGRNGIYLTGALLCGSGFGESDLEEMKRDLGDQLDSVRFFAVPGMENAELLRGRENRYKSYYMGLESETKGEEIEKICQGGLYQMPVLLKNGNGICCSGLLKYAE